MADSVGQFYINLLLLIACSFQSAIGQSIEAETSPLSEHYGEIRLMLKPPELKLLNIINRTQEDFASFFYVQVRSKINLLGTYAIQDSAIVFRPRFVPDPSLQHVVHYDPAALQKLSNVEGPTGSVLQRTITFDRPISTSTKIMGISPHLDTIPENLLRLYINFSNPMGLENPYDFIQLLDSEGMVVQDAFVEIPNGLWNRERTRLTLLFHPGRIKRGVGPRRILGPHFTPHRDYSLNIRSGWKDSQGNAIEQPLKKRFVVEEAVRKRIDPGGWQLRIPSKGELTHLTLETSSHLDPVLARRMLQIKHEQLGQVSGHWHQLDAQDWHFYPKQEWVSGEYTLWVDPALEDIAGNTRMAVMDRSVTTQVTEVKSIKSISFTVE